MDEQSLNESKVIAALWFGLSIGIVGNALLRLPTEKPLLIPGVLSFAYILFMMGRQRTTKWQMEPSKFNRHIQIAAVAAVILCAFSIPLSIATG